MNYSLGNMLNGGESLNADGLSLDLQFATDKTLTARKGPTPVFTRASTATFVGSNGLIQSAAINDARFDHDPSTLVSRGLLIEESRTNLALRSADFTSVSWVKSNSTISGTLYTDPTGASTANELVEDTLLNNHTCQQSVGAATIGVTYTFSVFVKRKDTSNQFMLIGASGLASTAFMSVNLTNGVTATSIGSPAAPINVSSTAYPNGWYRVQFSIVATNAATIVLDIRLSRDGTWANRSYLGDGVQSSLVWGAQVEAGAFPTSYIPTTTASVVRSADVCSITGANFSGSNFYNQSEGTLFADVIGLMDTTISGGRQFVVFSDNTYANTIGIVKQSGTAFLQASARTSNVSQFTFSNVYVPLTRYKVAIGMKANDANVAFNGSLGTTVTSVTMPSTISELELRDPTGASAGQPTCHIAAIRYYKKRLANAKLQTLTT